MLEYASLLADLGAGILHGSPLLHLLESGRVEDSISMFAFMSAMLEHNICGGEVERQLQHGVLAAGISDSTSAHPLLRRALLGPNYLVSSSVSFVSAR
ncbi:MAG: uncharacterized protein KVP18_001917 [Porospora cf. gigantea A]|nr:MAG: hypothetical protein KVP18_001917 [Porospora cf. gigantea A]